MKTVLRGHPVVGGVARGAAIVAGKAFAFSHGVDPATGIVTDVRHELNGKKITGRILVYPYGRGSSTGDLWMLETTRCGNAPAAIVNIETEPITVSGAILSKMVYGKEIPIVDKLDKNPIEVIMTGDYVMVDGTLGVVEILERER